MLAPVCTGCCVIVSSLSCCSFSTASKKKPPILVLTNTNSLFEPPIFVTSKLKSPDIYEPIKLPKEKSVPNKYFSFLFFISFEIYLMFELVSEGRYSLMRIIDNPFFAFVVYVISSVLLGCILHFIVKYIKNMCFNCS